MFSLHVINPEFSHDLRQLIFNHVSTERETVCRILTVQCTRLTLHSNMLTVLVVVVIWQEELA